MSLEVPITVTVTGVEKIQLPPERLGRIVKVASARYSNLMRERFVKFSRGNGNWKPLKQVTIKRRRKPARIKKSPEQEAIKSQFETHNILVDTAVMQNSLTMSPMGASEGMNIDVQHGAGVTTGVLSFKSRLHPHPKPKGKKKKTSKGAKEITIPALVAIHHFGSAKRHIPARPILVQPTPEQLKKIENVVVSEVKRALN